MIVELQTLELFCREALTHYLLYILVFECTIGTCYGWKSRPFSSVVFSIKLSLFASFIPYLHQIESTIQVTVFSMNKSCSAWDNIVIKNLYFLDDFVSYLHNMLGFPVLPRAHQALVKRLFRVRFLCQCVLLSFAFSSLTNLLMSLNSCSSVFCAHF